MSALLSGPYLVAAGLLAVAGAEKSWHPDATRRALAAAGWPVRRELVRLGGVGEAILGAAAIVAGGPGPAMGVAVSYVLLAGFVLFALTRGTPLSSCGCFGQVDTPPTAAHVAVNLVAAAVAAAVAAGPSVTIRRTIGGQPLHGVPFAVLAGTCGYLVYLILTSSARLLAVRRGGQGAQR